MAIRSQELRAHVKAQMAAQDAKVPHGMVSCRYCAKPIGGTGLQMHEERCKKISARQQHTSGRMNKTEAAYAERLRLRVLADEVASFQFEAVKLRIAERCFYTPDFLVVTPDDHYEFHEVKGRKGDGFYAREDAIIKVKAAAALFSTWRFFIVWPAEGGAWREKEIRP